ncbi:alpha-L-fucosidase-like [Epargyreus clarus]|uniref:alpha-L-fucosidase-like n=1 Tax=Epargyreus clarus TaxID=520877 RepID=UPI003C2AD55A
MNLLMLFVLVGITSAKVRKVKTSTTQFSVKTAEKVYDNSDDFLNKIIESETLNVFPTSPTLEDEVTEETVTEYVSPTVGKRYAPQWSSLDTRPLPEWYDRAKVGIFLHWGVYSVPGFGSEWFWSNWEGGNKDIEDFMNKTYPPGFTYQEFAPLFKGEFFDPNAWAELFSKAGAKYVVLTSKHHDGFTMFPSRRSFSWNSVDVGPKRDIVGELAQAVRNNDMKFGVYHSLYEWYNPIYLEDKKALFLRRNYPQTKVWPDIQQLVNDYKPSVLWSDGDWEAFDSYWNSTDLLAWLYNDSPVKDEIVVNDRWGIGIPCHHGDFYNCADRYNPGTLQNHKWENAFTVDSKSWGYRRNMALSEILSINQLIKEVVTTVSCGGNVLINIGPTKEGTIAPIFQERLLTLGLWLSINGEAIYDTSPWTYQNDTLNPDVWYTCKKTEYDGLHPTSPPQNANDVPVIYAILLRWPADDVLKLENVANSLHAGTYQIQMLGVNGPSLNWRINRGIAYIHLPDRNTVSSRHAWALRFVRK